MCSAWRAFLSWGVTENPRLRQKAEALLERAARDYQATGQKQHRFGDLRKRTRGTGRGGGVIVKAEHTVLRFNPRFVVTNLTQTDRYLYDQMYCARRGDMENRLKDQQLLDRFARSGGPVIASGPTSFSAVAVGFGLYLD